MCEIFHILKNSFVDDQKLINAAANNWHSWGLLAKDEKKKQIHVLRGVPQNSDLPDENPLVGGCHEDIDQIQEFLKKHKKLERFVHFRHATRGSINMANCHPFLVYDDGERQVYFMHNGAISQHGVIVNSTNVKWINGKRIVVNETHEEIEADSDTKEFVEKRLITPLKWVKGDYNDSDFQEHIWKPLWDKYGGNSRVLLVANDIEPLKVGTWSTYLDPNTKDDRFYASDPSYLEKVTRGPVFTKEKAEEERRRREEEKNNPKVLESSSQFTPITDGMFQPDARITKGIAAVFKDFGEQLDPGDISDLYLCSIPEFNGAVDMLMKEENGTLLIAGFIDRLIRDYNDLFTTLQKVKEDKKKGENHIIANKSLIEGLEAQCHELRTKLQAFENDGTIHDAA